MFFLPHAVKSLTSVLATVTKLPFEIGLCFLLAFEPFSY